MDDYAIVAAIEAEDSYADTDVPGEFRRLTEDFWAASPEASQED